MDGGDPREVVAKVELVFAVEISMSPQGYKKTSRFSVKNVVKDRRSIL